MDSLLQTASVDTVNSAGTSLLLAAVFCRQQEVFDYLIEKGADVTIQNEYGGSPIVYAARNANVNMVTTLLDKGADVNAATIEGFNPLYVAVQRDSEETVQLLLDNGAKVASDTAGISPLQWAVLNENQNIVEKLIEHSADIDAVNNIGNTPLAIALRQGSMKIAELLIYHGADKNKVRTFDLRGPYAGQPDPGLKATAFAPGFVTTENFNHTPGFSPDGNIIYFTTESKPLHWGSIMETRYENGRWTAPEPASVEGDFREIDPFVTLDGLAMYYSSDRPINPGDTVTGNIDMWMVKKEGNGWGEPIHLGPEVNSEHAEWFPTLSANGNLYFSTGPGRSSNIVYSEFKDGKYQAPIDLGDSVNSERRDYDPFIAPDESYVMWSSNRPGGLGSIDIYISFRKGDGTWGKAKNMGELVNSSAGEFAPRVSPDGKYLFFNRRGDIYWISAEVIETLRE